MIRENTDKLFNLLNNYFDKVVYELDLGNTFVKNFNLINLKLLNSEGTNHGDLHLGNILIDKGEVLFIDYESVFHLGVSDVLDWINLSRFIQLDNINKYFKNNNISLISDDSYKMYFNWLMMKNLCVLMYLKEKNKWIIEDEFKKFTAQIIK